MWGGFLGWTGLSQAPGGMWPPQQQGSGNESRVAAALKLFLGEIFHYFPQRVIFPTQTWEHKLLLNFPDPLSTGSAGVGKALIYLALSTP